MTATNDASLLAAVKEIKDARPEVLESLTRQFQGHSAAITGLIALSEEDDPTRQIAATWLLKRMQEREVPLRKRQVDQIIALLAVPKHPMAQLHLLQMLPALEWPSGQKRSILQSLKREMGDSNKLVRAWAFNGLAKLGDVFEDLQPEVAPLLRFATKDESAAVKARMRHVVREYPWTTQITGFAKAFARQNRPRLNARKPK